MVIWKRTKQFVKKHWKLISLCCLVALLWYAFCLPRPLFKDPVAMVIEDRQGQLLGARIAEDGQWRFPEIDSVPDKFAQALILFEDKRFYSHPGVMFGAWAEPCGRISAAAPLKAEAAPLPCRWSGFFKKEKKEPSATS
jgi:membrane peptidoglycan carboxypeptidase